MAALNWKASGLRLRIRAVLVDRISGAVVGTLGSVKSFSLEKNLNATVRGGATLEMDVNRPVDWRAVLVRVYITGGRNGVSETHPVITGVPTVPAEVEDDAQISTTVTLRDRTSALDDIVGMPQTFPAGQPVLYTLQQILADRGIAEPRISDAAGGTPIRETYTAKTGASWRSVVTDLAQSIGYGAAWADPMGVLVLAPYVEPAQRAPLFTVGDDPAALPTDSRVERTLKSSVPNHFILYTGSDTPLIAEGWDDLDSSPWSIYNQPVIAYSAQVEAADQASLNKQLAQVMADAKRSDTTYTLKTRFFALGEGRELELMDAGRVRLPARGLARPDPINAVATVTKINWSWAAGSVPELMTLELEGVD